MGRGRAKAKQTKVARELKYHSPNTDLTALQRELAGAGGKSDHHFDDDRSTVRLSYRFYRDSYRINAHTVQAEWVKPVTSNFVLTPLVRRAPMPAEVRDAIVAAAQLRAAVSAVDRAVPVDRIETVEQLVSASVAQPRFRTVLVVPM